MENRNIGTYSIDAYQLSPIFITNYDQTARFIKAARRSVATKSYEFDVKVGTYLRVLTGCAAVRSYDLQ